MSLFFDCCVKAFLCLYYFGEYCDILHALLHMRVLILICKYSIVSSFLFLFLFLNGSRAISELWIHRCTVYLISIVNILELEL